MGRDRKKNLSGNHGHFRSGRVTDSLDSDNEVFEDSESEAVVEFLAELDNFGEEPSFRNSNEDLEDSFFSKERAKYLARTSQPEIPSV